MDAALEEERPSVETKEKSMEAIDELISAAQTIYDDARANENGRSRSWIAIASFEMRGPIRPRTTTI